MTEHEIRHKIDIIDMHWADLKKELLNPTAKSKAQDKIDDLEVELCDLEVDMARLRYRNERLQEELAAKNIEIEDLKNGKA